MSSLAATISKKFSTRILESELSHMLQKVAIVGGFSRAPQASVFEVSGSSQLSLPRTDASAKMSIFSNLDNACRSQQTGIFVQALHTERYCFPDNRTIVFIV